MKTVTNLNDPRLVRALAHPLRARAFSALQERVASPSELAEEFDAPIANVSYHVKTLADLKLVRLVKTTPRRGAVEHHYKAVSMAHITNEAWGESPTIVKNAMVASALDEVRRTVTDAAGTGGFDREDAHLTRTRLELDEQGWTELAELLLDVLDKTDRIQEKSAKRLKKADHQGERHGALVMMMCEVLETPDSPPPARGKKPAKVQSSSRSRAR